LLFPSYIFILVVAQWYAARWSPGVIRLVTAGDAKPARVPDAIINELRSREGADGLVALPMRPALRPGDRVRITAGAFSGHLALYQGLTSAERVAVLLAFLGGPQRTELAASAIEPVEVAR